MSAPQTAIELDVSNVEQANREAAAALMLDKVGKTLDKFYPGHKWIVEFTGQIIRITNIRLAGNVGINLTPDEVYNENNLKRWVGELFERFGVDRGAFNKNNTPVSEQAVFADMGRVSKRMKQQDNLVLPNMRGIAAGVHQAIHRPTA